MSAIQRRNRVNIFCTFFFSGSVSLLRWLFTIRFLLGGFLFQPNDHVSLNHYYCYCLAVDSMLLLLLLFLRPNVIMSVNFQASICVLRMSPTKSVFPCPLKPPSPTIVGKNSANFLLVAIAFYHIFQSLFFFFRSFSSASLNIRLRPKCFSIEALKSGHRAMNHTKKPHVHKSWQEN